MLSFYCFMIIFKYYVDKLWLIGGFFYNLCLMWVYMFWYDLNIFLDYVIWYNVIFFLVMILYILIRLFR